MNPLNDDRLMQDLASLSTVEASEAVTTRVRQAARDRYCSSETGAWMGLPPLATRLWAHGFEPVLVYGGSGGFVLWSVLKTLELFGAIS